TLSYRSRLNEKPVSTSSFDDTVDVHFADPVANVGVCHTTDAVAGSVFAPIAWPRRRIARSLYTATLLRGDTCHVTRTTGLSIFSSEMPCSQAMTAVRHCLNPRGGRAPRRRCN